MVEFLIMPPNSLQPSVENSSCRSTGGLGLKPIHNEIPIPIMSEGITPHSLAISVDIPKVKSPSNGPPTTPNNTKDACKIPPKN